MTYSIVKVDNNVLKMIQVPLIKHKDHKGKNKRRFKMIIPISQIEFFELVRQKD